MLHMYADHIYLKLLGNRTSVSCMIRRTGISLRKDLVSGLYRVFLLLVKHNLDFCTWLSNVTEPSCTEFELNYAFAYMRFPVAWTVA